MTGSHLTYIESHKTFNPIHLFSNNILYAQWTHTARSKVLSACWYIECSMRGVSVFNFYQQSFALFANSTFNTKVCLPLVFSTCCKNGWYSILNMEISRIVSFYADTFRISKFKSRTHCENCVQFPAKIFIVRICCFLNSVL